MPLKKKRKGQAGHQRTDIDKMLLGLPGRQEKALSAFDVGLAIETYENLG